MLGDDAWWASHWESAPAEICAFLAEDGVQVAGAAVADFGCGDGIMAGALASQSGASVVGFDLTPLTRRRSSPRQRPVATTSRNSSWSFARSHRAHLTLATLKFDIGVSWSAMEHVFDRAGYMREAHRVIKPMDTSSCRCGRCGTRNTVIISGNG